MKFIDKVWDSLASRVAEGIAASLAVLLVWACYEVAPAVLPAIEAVTSKKVLLALLVTSLVLNVVLAIVIWFLAKKEPFRLNYGIYWNKDKQPHCPACKTPIGGYRDHTSGKGYYCKPCGKLFELQDIFGNDVDPIKAISEL